MNPKLAEVKGEPLPAVVPEWRAMEAAHGASNLNGKDAARYMRAFRDFFKRVAAASRARLRVDKSTVQVCRRPKGGLEKKGEARGDRK